MRQNLDEARRTSAYVLDLISKKTLSDEERARVIDESVRFWTDHVNEGFLQFRKSVSTDYTSVEWEDEGAVFRDIQFAFLTNSGTESVEGCLKMATLATGRHHYIGTVGAFHGKSMGSLGGTSKAVFREPFLPLMHWTHLPWGDVDILAKMMKAFDFTGDRVAAVVIEPIQGEGGINVAPPGYLAAARELCDRYGAMLVFDEIQSGMGRSGKMFACEHDGVAPDLMAMGKGFGGGVMPIGAFAGTAKTWEKYIENPFLHTTTFGGNPVACAAAIATIQVLLAEDLPKQAGEKGDYLLGKFAELGARYPKLLKLWRGRGLMLGLEFVDDTLGWQVAKNLFARQILIGGTYINARTLRVEPPLTISYPQLDRFLRALDESMAAVYAEHHL